MSSLFMHADALLVSLKSSQILSATIPATLQNYLVAGTPVPAMMKGKSAAIMYRAEAGLVCTAAIGVDLRMPYYSLR